MTAPHAALVAVAAGGPDDLRLSRLEALLDPVFLSEAGWDAELGLLQPSPDHRLLGWSHCSMPGCKVEATNRLHRLPKSASRQRVVAGSVHRFSTTEEARRRRRPVADR
jgi:hypothetical protein